MKIFMSLLFMAILVACATVPTGPLAPGELRLLSLQAPERIQAKVPYDVVVVFDSEKTPQVSRACFYWSGSIPREGPYCFPARDVEGNLKGTFKVRLRTNNPGVYVLDGYAEFLRDGKTTRSNEVGITINVR